MAEAVTIGAAVGWVISVVGWGISPIVSTFLNERIPYLSLDTRNKLQQLQVLQLELMLQREAAGIHQLKPLLKNLQSVFYDAEDILDDVEYHRLERQIVPKTKRGLMHGVQSVLPMCSCLKNQAASTSSSGDPPPIVSRQKLEKIVKKIEQMVTSAHRIFSLLNLRPSCGYADMRQILATNNSGVATTRSPPDLVIGRDDHRDTILKMLHETVDDDQPESSNALPYSIIGIHGFPGSGKSTLAQYICAHQQNDNHFNVIMWVYVSLNFSVHTILKNMIMQATGLPSPETEDLTILQNHLEEGLRGKRFFLVLDDVWFSKDVYRQQELQQIISPLKVGKRGSKILATSRTSDALSALGAIYFPIPELLEGDFNQLFMHYALPERIDGRDQRKFDNIGVDIARKLRLSPLAAKTVGGQLRIRPKVRYWENARDQDILNDTIGALWWSYQLLDEPVRRCFAYCSIFPRGYQLGRSELVNLWVAEGFITSTNRGQDMGALGENYFDELVSTSFLQKIVNGGKECYIIHDLLHDLIEKVAESDCFRIENGWEGEIPGNIRHLLVETSNAAVITNKIVKLKKLRTLIIYTDKHDTAIREEIFKDIFTRLRKLRVLSLRLWRTETISFPASIGRLKHLRYLSVRRYGSTAKIILPRKFSRLYHLQLLDCPSIVFSSCEDMVKLVSLRHISTLGALDFPNIGRLTSLQNLPSYRVKKEPGYEIHQLKHLNKLQDMLGIHGLENVGSKEEALEANLAAKERLTHMILGWDRHDGQQSGSAADLQADVLEGLRPPVHLDVLHLWSYNGSRYPDWVVGVRGLLLLECSRLEAIPDRQEFSSLLLQLDIYMCSWDALPDNMERLTSLQKLDIDQCENLRSLPTLPPSLLHFEISSCDHGFMKSCKETGDQNWEKLKDIPRVIIRLGSSNGSEDDAEELS